MDALKKKIGPLPLWGWLLALVGGILLAVVIKRALGSGSSEPEPAAPADPYADGDQAPTGSIGLPNAAVPGSPAPAPITDNVSWRAKALQYLIGQGTSPSVADRTLAKYMEGRRLTVDQDRLIGMALAALGLPPDPPPLAPYPRPNPPGRNPGTPNPTPDRPATKAAAIAKCLAGDYYPDMYADFFALGVSVNAPKLKGTACGAGYAAWLIANKGARPTPEDQAPPEPPTRPRQAPRPTVPPATGSTEPYPVPAAPVPIGTVSVVPSAAPAAPPIVLRPTGDALPAPSTPAPMVTPTPTPTSSTRPGSTSKGSKGNR